MRLKRLSESGLPHWKDVLQNGIENFLPYIEQYGEVDDVDELWDGYCNRVVNILKEETDLIDCGGEILYLSDEPLEDGEPITGFHWFIAQGGRFYDASVPYGVDLIDDLPIVSLLYEEHPNPVERKNFLLKNTMLVDKATSNTRWDSSKTLWNLGWI